MDNIYIFVRSLFDKRKHSVIGVIHNSKLAGDNYGNKFLHLVNSDDCGHSIFLDFDRKMGKEKIYETTIPRKLIDCCKTL